MNSYTHMVIGGLSGGVLAVIGIAQVSLGLEINSHTIYPLVGIVPAVIGAIGPDIDLPNSKSGRKVRKALVYLLFGTGTSLLVAMIFSLLSGGSVGDLKFPFLAFAFACGLFVLIKTAKHRGVTHTGLLWICMVVIALLYICLGHSTIVSDLVLSCYIGFIVGWFSHLGADSFNKKGVPWLYPIFDKKYHVATVLTGSYEESIFRIIAIGFFVVLYALIIMFGR